MNRHAVPLWMAAWLALAARAAGGAVEGATPPERPALPAIKVAVDTSDAPEMAAWAAQARELCEKSYPMILEHLGAPGFDPPKKVQLIFKKQKGIAGTSGTTITCAAAWFLAHPDDYGAVIHELCHVVQAYGGKPVPGWVTEGIADYVRWFNFEPPNRRPRVDPARAKYTQGYQTTAAFLDWIVRTKDKSFVNRLNDAARNGGYKPELFREFAGKPLDDLWAEFIESLRNK